MDDNNFEEDNSSYKSIPSDDYTEITEGQVIIGNTNQTVTEIQIKSDNYFDLNSSFPAPSRPASCMKPMPLNKLDECHGCKGLVNEPFCHVKLNSILKLKESTKKLLCLLEEIQTKTISKKTIVNDTPNLTSNPWKPIPDTKDLLSFTDLLSASGLKKLESQTNTLEVIYVPDDDDDCSIYKRLTRKCNCLNKQDYNDFIIHFNEDIKYFTSNFGEVIKNMRILKKFLYMNGDYTKRALMFLNEGLSESSHTEKVEIIQGCAYADMCNVFDDHSIAVICISWPCTYYNYGDSETQALAATFLYKLSEIEEGRRYLNFSSKITNNIKKILRKKVSKLDFSVVDTLNATLNLLHPPIFHYTPVTYYCKPVDEGMGIKKTINALVQYRQYMTLNEVLNNLELLDNWSNRNNGKTELTLYLPALLDLFKNMLMEYDHSQMNIIVTSILSNVVANSILKGNEPELPKTLVIADTATEPVEMKNRYNQIPPKKPRKNYKNNSGLGLSPTKHRAQSKRKVSSGWEPSGILNKSKNFGKVSSGRESSGLVNKSRNFRKAARSTVIVVPIEE